MADMTLKYTVLGLLHYKNLHGYRICEHIEQHFGQLWTINPGQIYPVLRALEEEGLIRMVEVVQKEQKGPYRKLYAITDKGRAEFQSWLADSPGKGMIVRDPFLTRFVFFDYGDKEQALTLIDEQISIWQEEWDKRQFNRERWNQQSIYLRLISQLGSNTNGMYLDWLKYAREEIVNSMKEE
ncbi:MAG: transcriptional regulator, PadR-like family [Firmicutes bacterium]|nr:transcriptional regulator, PadR-like family [Bacillota bacterium]